MQLYGGVTFVRQQ